jgi:hypothetical protein
VVWRAGGRGVEVGGVAGGGSRRQKSGRCDGTRGEERASRAAKLEGAHRGARSGKREAGNGAKDGLEDEARWRRGKCCAQSKGRTRSVSNRASLVCAWRPSRQLAILPLPRPGSNPPPAAFFHLFSLGSFPALKSSSRWAGLRLPSWTLHPHMAAGANGDGIAPCLGNTRRSCSRPSRV